MIFVNQDKVNTSITAEWMDQAELHTIEAKRLESVGGDVADFIKKKREDTWGHDDLIVALRKAVGNKCWYSEVRLEGTDVNVDHFRPKGRVVEVDADLQKTGDKSDGYWWLAFEILNFRLTSMHSNQRRVDESTHGGKWDFFPVNGARASATTDYHAIVEDVIPLDPCVASDVSLLWFDPDGKPCCREWRRNAPPTDAELLRIKTTIWLYHLNKREVQSERSNHVQGIRSDLRKADAQFKLWNRHSATPDLAARNRFNDLITEIKTRISDEAIFAGAKRCAVRSAMSKYEWIEEFDVI